MKTTKTLSLLLAIILIYTLPVFGQSTIPPAVEIPVSEATPNSSILATPVPQGLQLFGSGLFTPRQQNARALTPGGYLPPDYRLGPGDRLGIFLGGKTQEQFEAFVSLDGQIYIPTVGVFQVTGFTLKQFSEKLDEKLGSLYSNYDVNVMLLVPKTVWVNVIGEVNAPGQYPINALNSVLGAISLAQGVTERGSLRNVQIFRADSLVGRVDLYDFILSPSKTENHYIQNGDKIFVPVLSSTVAVEGEINRNAIYELDPNKDETVWDIVELAGGFTGTALKKKVELSRIENGIRTVQYLDLSDHIEPNQTNLQNNDRITVFSIRDQFPSTFVTIHGEVKEPGVFEFEENMCISDLILKAGNLTRSAYKLTAHIAYSQPDGSVWETDVDLQSVLSEQDSTQDLLLLPDAHVFIRKIPDWELNPIVEIRGEVVFPGDYAVIKDTTMLSEVLAKAGGFTDEALVQEAKLLRMREQFLPDKEFERLALMRREEMSDLEYEYFVMQKNLGDANEVIVDFFKLMVLKDKNEDVALQPGDVIIVPEKQHVVYVSGRVSNPGGVLYKSGAKLDYYIKKAGGFAWDAHKRKTRITKITGEIKDDEDVEIFEPGDRIWVPRKPDRNYWQITRDVILVAGQMATIYLVIRNATRN